MSRFIAFFSAVSWFIADLVSKQWASLTLENHKIVINSWLNFALAHNKGAAFSFLADSGGWQRWLFIAIALIVSAWLIYLIIVEKIPALVRVAYGFVLGGALGNVYDRLTLGHVIDFIQCHLGQYYWPTFNVADIAITIGVSILVIMAILDWRGNSRAV